MYKKVKVIIWFSIKTNRDGLVAIYVFKPSSPTFWELAFHAIIMGDCILNGNTDELTAAVNHRVE